LSHSGDEGLASIGMVPLELLESEEKPLESQWTESRGRDCKAVKDGERAIFLQAKSWVGQHDLVKLLSEDAGHPRDWSPHGSSEA
jgi:hypothetical protein